MLTVRRKWLHRGLQRGLVRDATHVVSGGKSATVCVPRARLRLLVNVSVRVSILTFASERRPSCKNCEKTHVVCEGYDEKLLWAAKQEARKARKTINLNHSELHPEIDSYIGSLGNLALPNTLQSQSLAFSQHSPSAFYGQEYGLNTFDFGIGQFGTPSSFDTHRLGPPSPDNGAAVFGGYQHETRNDAQYLISAMEESLSMLPAVSLAETVAQKTILPPDLPYLIKGIESDIHKCLFLHFTHVLSPLLTTSNGKFNPMNSEVIPLAICNRTVMKTVLCLAASHRLVGLFSYQFAGFS